MGGNAIRSVYAFTPDDVQFTTHFKGASPNRIEAVRSNPSIPTLASSMKTSAYGFEIVLISVYSVVENI
ncbi:unnamed protein product [Nezara viridula]|uniref:Uncharacterized protein n=1 Tax=Nezara viridula TaxID=85310 RepID=A0A9P0MU57_NEZVI|nr:unnamed protein product [Nezara viridula]